MNEKIIKRRRKVVDLINKKIQILIELGEYDKATNLLVALMELLV